MRAQGFKVQKIEDTSQMQVVTEFQQSLPLSRMTLNEYERRLKKLLDPQMGDEINTKQLVECFKDHYAFKEIADENSAVYRLLTDEVFQKDSKDSFHVPYLMLLGLLVCATNEKNKADKFFELCQIELNDKISHQDGEFVDYFPKIIEIAYDTLIRHYNLNNPENKKEHWLRPQEKMGELYSTIFEEVTDKLFMDGDNVVSSLENDKFIERIHKKFQEYLQAHKIRNIVFDKLASA